MSRPRRCSLLVCLAVLATAAPAPAQDRADLPSVVWEPWVASDYDGSALEGRLGRLRVPERRDRPDGATIELAFVVYPSTSADPGPPIYFLAGGPGGSGVQGCLGPATGRMLRLLDFGDVVGIDQRGTGLSRPSLVEEPDFSYELPADVAITRDDVVAAERASIGRRVTHWTGAGVDVTAYDTAESADDLDDVRRALGHEEIVLYGSSYGTHLGLAYLRRHPEHVARAVLSRVEGPDHTFKLPSQIQHQVERLAELVAADAGLREHLPDLTGSIRSLLEQLRAEPARVTFEAEGRGEVTVAIGPYDLQRGLAALLADRRRLEQLPVIVHELVQGRWTEMAPVALGHRRGGDYPTMALMMDCASGASRARRERIRSERDDPANLLSDAMYGFHVDLCAACGDIELPDSFRAPPRCDVPVLFVSGELDARTPPSNVDEIRDGFTDCAHVVVQHTGHISYELRSEAFRELQWAFLRGEDVGDATIDMPPLEFLPIGGE